MITHPIRDPRLSNGPRFSLDVAIMKHKYASGDHDTVASTVDVTVSPRRPFLRAEAIDMVKQIPFMAAAVVNGKTNGITHSLA